MTDESSKTQSGKGVVTPIWAIVATVIAERPYGPGGQQMKHGTHTFRAGQKVYLQDAFERIEPIHVTIIGRYHGKHEYISCVVPTAHLANFQAELVYSPTIIERIQYGYMHRDERKPLSEAEIAKHWLPMDGSQDSKQKAVTLALRLDAIAERERQKWGG